MHSHCSVVAALIPYDNSLLPSSLIRWHVGCSLSEQCHSYFIMSPDRFRYAPLHSVHGAVCPVPGMSGCAVFPTYMAAAGMLVAGKPGLAGGWEAVMPGTLSMVSNGSLGICTEVDGPPNACADDSGLGAAACSSSCCSGGGATCATRCFCKCRCQLASALRRVRAL